MIYALRRLAHRKRYRAALAAYWAAENMDDERAAHRELCWFGNDGGFGRA